MHLLFDIKAYCTLIINKKQKCTWQNLLKILNKTGYVDKIYKFQKVSNVAIGNRKFLQFSDMTCPISYTCLNERMILFKILFYDNLYLNDRCGVISGYFSSYFKRHSRSLLIRYILSLVSIKQKINLSVVITLNHFRLHWNSYRFCAFAECPVNVQCPSTKLLLL